MIAPCLFSLERSRFMVTAMLRGVVEVFGYPAFRFSGRRVPQALGRRYTAQACRPQCCRCNGAGTPKSVLVKTERPATMRLVFCLRSSQTFACASFSWGDTRGNKGFFLMTNAWFDEYLFQVR